MPVYLRVLVPFMALCVSLSVSAQSKTGSAQDKAQPDEMDPYPSNQAKPQMKTNLRDEATEHLRMEVGQTRLIQISSKIIRVSVAEITVADVQVVTAQQVLITAKAVGYTHLILWGSDDKPLVIAVSVTRNLDQLRTQFAELFPKEQINVSSVGDLIVLSGTVSDLRLPARAAEVAGLYTERLANLITVTGDQQVQLDVRFAEVSRTGMRKAGLNFLWSDSQRGYVAGQSTAGTTPGQYLRGEAAIPGTGNIPGPPLIPGATSGDSFNLFFSTGLADFPFSAILSILSQEGLAKMLAEPTLVAMSGQEAQFHAGGEIPILVSQQLGQVSMQFKKFGVRLFFTPTVLGEKSMTLKLGVEVSEPDSSAGVVVSGYQVPGFKMRSSETTIRLRDGQSFAIAGLLSDSMRALVSKVPLLGDIPILGMLFRSTAYQREETELLMVITAHLVRPLTPEEVPFLPGEDEFNDPNDFMLFLMGSMEGKKTEAAKEREEREKKAKNAENKRGNPPRNQNRESDSIKGTQTSDQRELEGPLGPVGFIRG